MLPFDLPPPGDDQGVVYTKPWVVELMLDLAGYSSDADLVDALAIEPAAGEGAFVVEMARRLIASCRARGRPISGCLRSLIAFEIDEAGAEAARSAVFRTLRASSVEAGQARELATTWIRSGDFLLHAPTLPPADFVVGNPPYVRLEGVPAEATRAYRNSYPTMQGRADLYVGFIEAALRGLKPSGVCAYICADRWMLNQYGAGLRHFITSAFNVETIIEMHDADPFASTVSAYPAITVIRAGAQGRVVVATSGAPAGQVDATRLALSLRPSPDGTGLRPLPPIASATVVETWFEGDAPWPIRSPGRLALLRRLEEQFQTLEDGESTKVGIGVATGCDRVFITKNADLVETSRMLPLAMASDTSTGHLLWSGSHLVDPWGPEGLVALPNFPRLRAYLERHESDLRARHTAKSSPASWYKTIDRVTHSLVAKPKLYIADIKDEFNPVLDRGETYPHHNL